MQKRKHTKDWKIVNVISLLLLTAYPLSLNAYAQLTNGMDADVVIGQPDFTLNTAGRTNQRVNQPRGIFPYKNGLFVTEEINDRVIFFQKIPKTNFASADVVLGQPNFTASVAGVNASTLDWPESVLIANGKLLISSRNENRVLIWNRVPTTNGAPADIVIGQPDFVSSNANQGGTVAANTLNQPYDLGFDGQRLYVSDISNHRVLIFDSIPAHSNASASLVIGQPDFTSSTSSLGSKGFNFPTGLEIVGDKLIISDFSNNRILIWNSLPKENHASADVVIGQPDFQSSEAELSQRGTSGAIGVAFAAGHLFVADSFRRVMVWEGIPTRNHEIATFVLGKPDFQTSLTPISAASLQEPIGIESDGRRLFVADDNNHRVLIYNINKPDADDLGPQFSQGKAVVGKVFWDMDGNGRQNA